MVWSAQELHLVTSVGRLGIHNDKNYVKYHYKILEGQIRSRSNIISRPNARSKVIYIISVINCLHVTKFILITFLRFIQGSWYVKGHLKVIFKDIGHRGHCQGHKCNDGYCSDQPMHDTSSRVLHTSLSILRYCACLHKYYPQSTIYNSVSASIYTCLQGVGGEACKLGKWV